MNLRKYFAILIGEGYKKLKECITVNILDFDMFDGDECHSEFGVLEMERHELLTKNCSIHFFELKKAENDVNLTENQKNWLRIIKADNEEEFDMLEKKNDPIINEAVDTIYKMSADEKLQEIIRLRERARDEEMSAIHDTKEEGKAEGLKEGLVQGVQSVIDQLKNAGLFNDEIAKLLANQNN